MVNNCRIYWVDLALPGIRSVRQNGEDAKVMLHAVNDTFRDVTVYQVGCYSCRALFVNLLNLQSVLSNLQNALVRYYSVLSRHLYWKMKMKSRVRSLQIF